MVTTRSEQPLHNVIGANKIYYTLFVKDPINIEYTGNISDDTQKNLELLIQNIGIRSMPVEYYKPERVKQLGKLCNLKGKGWAWRFAVEHAGIFTSDVIKDTLHGLILSDGTIDFDGSYDQQNIEVRKE